MEPIIGTHIGLITRLSFQPINQLSYWVMVSYLIRTMATTRQSNCLFLEWSRTSFSSAVHWFVSRQIFLASVIVHKLDTHYPKTICTHCSLPLSCFLSMLLSQYSPFSHLLFYGLSPDFCSLDLAVSLFLFHWKYLKESVLIFKHKHQISAQRPPMSEKQRNIRDKEECYIYVKTLACTSRVCFSVFECTLCLWALITPLPISCFMHEFRLSCCVIRIRRWWNTAHTGHVMRGKNGTHEKRGWGCVCPFMSHTITR